MRSLSRAGQAVLSGARTAQALGQIISKNIDAQDVTDEYTDLQLRLKNAEALRDRFAAILEKAANVKDTLEVERELNACARNRANQGRIANSTR